MTDVKRMQSIRAALTQRFASGKPYPHEGSEKVKNYKIGIRLGVGFGVLIVFSLVMLACGIYQLHQIDQRTRQMMQEPLQKERLVTDWYGVISASVQRTTAIARSSDDALSELFAAENAVASTGSSERQAEFAGRIAGPQEKALFDKLNEVRQSYIKVRDLIITVKSSGQLEQALTLLSRISDRRRVTIWIRCRPCATSSAPASTNWVRIFPEEPATVISFWALSAC